MLKKWAALPSGNTKYVNPKYVLTYDMLGIKPVKPVVCPFCRDETMIVRNTQLDWSFELDNMNLHIDLRLKCPKCDSWQTFGVPVPRDYFLFVYALRKKHGAKRTYAPSQEWLDEERIKERLKALGYW